MRPLNRDPLRIRNTNPLHPYSTLWVALLFLLCTCMGQEIGGGNEREPRDYLCTVHATENDLSPTVYPMKKIEWPVLVNFTHTTDTLHDVLTIATRIL